MNDFLLLSLAVIAINLSVVVMYMGRQRMRYSPVVYLGVVLFCWWPITILAMLPSKESRRDDRIDRVVARRIRRSVAFWVILSAVQVFSTFVFYDTYFDNKVALHAVSGLLFTGILLYRIRMIRRNRYAFTMK